MFGVEIEGGISTFSVGAPFAVLGLLPGAHRFRRASRRSGRVGLDNRPRQVLASLAFVRYRYSHQQGGDMRQMPHVVERFAGLGRRLSAANIGAPVFHLLGVDRRPVLGSHVPFPRFGGYPTGGKIGSHLPSNQQLQGERQFPLNVFPCRARWLARPLRRVFKQRDGCPSPCVECGIFKGGQRRGQIALRDLDIAEQI